MAKLTFILASITLLIAGVVVWLSMNYDPMKGKKLASNFLKKASLQIGDQYYKLAEENLDIAIDLDPTLLEAHYQRAVLNLKKDEMEDAIRDFSSVLALNPMYEKAYSSRGVAYFLSNNYDLAIKDFQTLRKLNPVFEEKNIAYLGNAFYRLGRLDEALEKFNEYLRTPGFQDDEEILFNRANVFYFKGELSRAHKETEKLISMTENPLRYYNLQGLIYRKEKNTREALLSFKKVMEVDKKFPDVYLNVGLLVYEEGMARRSLNYFSEAIRLSRPGDPNKILALRNRVNAFVAIQNYTMAIEDLTTIIEMKKDGGIELQAQYYVERANAYDKNEEQELALQDYNYVIDRIPAHDSALVRRGEFFASYEEWDKAIEDFKKAIEVNPEFSYCYYRLSSLYEMDVFEGREEQKLVLEYAKKAAEMHPEEPLYLERVRVLTEELKDEENDNDKEIPITEL